MYQALKMSTQKLHALYHLCEVVARVGDIKSLHAGVYEGSHKQFKPP